MSYTAVCLSRWTDEIDNEKWHIGTNKSYLQKLCKYCRAGFDWKKR